MAERRSGPTPLKWCLHDVKSFLLQLPAVADHWFSAQFSIVREEGRLPDWFLGQHAVEQAFAHPERRQLRFDRAKVTTHIQAIRFAWLGHQVADVEPGRAAALNGGNQFRHQQVGEKGGVKASWTKQNQIGVGNGFQGSR